MKSAPTLGNPDTSVAPHRAGESSGFLLCSNKAAGKMKKTAFPIEHVYQLLEPGPVLLVTTARKGRFDVMPMSWHSMFEFEPPLVGCIISTRSYTSENLRSAKECVLNIPTADLADQVVLCGNVSGRRFDKFKRSGLTPQPASCVKAPLVGECYASLECRLVDGSMIRKYSLFVLEVQQAWVNAARAKNPRTLHHRGYGKFMIAGKTIQLPSKMR